MTWAVLLSPVLWLAQGDPASVLLQYGAVGALAVVALGAVAVLFRQLLVAYQREQTRADKLEEEVRRLNEDVREQVMPALTRSTEAVSEAMLTLQTMRRR